MGTIEKKRVRYGLIGKNISYSFSKGYFTKKFKVMGLVGHSYENFDMANIEAFKTLSATPNDIKGFNVTIPYKEAILPYLTEIDHLAQMIGAVNTIKVNGNSLKGFNTDVYGFRRSLEPLLQKHHQNALIFGTGGASKAVSFALKELGIAHLFVSRKPLVNELGYDDLSGNIMKSHTILVNCTPLGTYPNILEKPDIPYQLIGKGHLLFDLIYNPDKSAFLQEGETRGAQIRNGHHMLELQAEKAWEIWSAPGNGKED